MNAKRNSLQAAACTALAAWVGLGSTSVLAQDAAANYPTKPVKIIVGFAPGGATDLVARSVAEKLTKALGQSFIIENRPGAGSNIGAELAARADADGYTLLMGTIANTISMSVYKNLKYDTLRDFVPISQLMAAPSVLVASPAFSARSVKEVIDQAKAKPGTITYASSGAGGSPHMAGAMLELRAGVQMVHVPYKGASPALRDVVSGAVNIGFKTALSALPSMQSGKLIPLAVAADKRLALLPNVPTMAEAGFPDFNVSSWNGLFAPRGTPPAIVNKLHREVVKVIAMPDIQKAFAAQAAVPVGNSPAEFRAFIEAEIKRWKEVAQAAKISL
jgi:tripartite-type tricarboxylate transporter receptor subunit TctC